MTIIVHENIGKELDDYLERRLRNYEVITPPIPKKPEIVTLEDDDKKKKHHKKDYRSGRDQVAKEVRQVKLVQRLIPLPKSHLF